MMLNTVLCLGDNTEETDHKTTQLAKQHNSINHGLLQGYSSLNAGYYHTSVADCSYQDLKKLIQEVDQVYVFDQQYEKPENFYRTIEIAHESNRAKYEDPESIDTYLYWSDLVKNNKSFCILPFIELQAQDKQTTLCCRDKTPVCDSDKVGDWQSNSAYKSIRNKMLQGIKIPEHCQTCYDLETKKVSPRINDTIEWAHKLKLNTVEDLKHITSPAYYEVRASNACNLQCRMCGPEWSNQIHKEYQQLGWITNDQKFEYTGFDIINFDNLRKLYIAGGEPTIQKPFLEFLKKQIQNNNTDFELHINTNATFVNNSFRELIKHFPNVIFTVSIDGFQELNYYIRYPSSWDTIMENCKWIQDQGYQLAFNTVTQVLNIGRLHQLFHFLSQNFPNAWQTITYAMGVMRIEAYPDQQSALTDLYNIKNSTYYHNNKAFTEMIDGMINYFRNQFIPVKDNKYYTKFIEYNESLDRHRNIRLEDYRPDLIKEYA
tara:strand:+ start:375 stop:1838 length:1464 start_codon:yes stop_codon:yes gene_type:complete